MPAKLQKTIVLTLVLFIYLSGLKALNAQSLLDEIPPDSSIAEPTYATFKANRIVLGPSIENIKKGELNFAVLHNFGPFSSGFQEFFGLDNANTSLNFDYGLSNVINLGLGRSTYQKTFEGYAKIRVLSQTNRVPLTASVFLASYVNGSPFPDDNPNYEWQHRLSYLSQVLLARKFNSRFSLQLAPFYLHKNLVEANADANDIFGLLSGARCKLINRLTVVAEFSWVIPDQLPELSVNYFGAGLELDTGGHVFQLRLSNTTSLFEPNFITQTQNKWIDGDISFGFTINRRFNLTD